MDITLSHKEGLKRKFHIIFSSDEIKKAKKNQLTTFSKTANVKGFRPGKVPAEIIETKYHDSLMLKAFESLIREGISKIYKDHSTMSIAEPDINVTKGGLQSIDEFEVDVAFETFPEIPKIDLTKIVLDKHSVKLTDKDTESFLTMLAEKHATYEPVKDRKEVMNEDVVLIDFKGTLDGEAFEGGSSKDSRLKIGSNTFIDGFESQLIGAKVGENIKIKVTFPKNYHMANLAGKEAEFEVIINNIEKSIPCDANDLPKKLGLKNLPDLKQDIKNRYEHQYEMINKNNLKEQIIEYFINEVEFNVPETLVEKEQKSLQERYSIYKESIENGQEQESSQGDIYKGKTNEEILEDQHKHAHKSVKLSLVFNNIADTNNLQVINTEVDQLIEAEANKYKGQEDQVIKYYKNNQQALNLIKSRVLEDKILSFIFSQIQYNDTVVSLSEYNKSLEKS